MVNISLVSVLFGGDLFVVFPKIIKWFMKKSCQTFVDKRGNSLFFCCFVISHIENCLNCLFFLNFSAFRGIGC